MIVLVLHYVLSETPHGTFMPEPPLNLSSAALNEIEQGVENTIANGKKSVISWLTTQRAALGILSGK